MSDSTPKTEDGLLMEVDNLLEEIVTPVVEYAAAGLDATEKAVECTKRMTAFIRAREERIRLSAKIEALHDEADAWRKVGKGLPPGFQKRMNLLQSQLDKLQKGGGS
jgi:hypothetical protein